MYENIPMADKKLQWIESTTARGTAMEVQGRSDPLTLEQKYRGLKPQQLYTLARHIISNSSSAGLAAGFDFVSAYAASRFGFEGWGRCIPRRRRSASTPRSSIRASSGRSCSPSSRRTSERRHARAIAQTLPAARLASGIVAGHNDLTGPSRKAGCRRPLLLRTASASSAARSVRTRDVAWLRTRATAAVSKPQTINGLRI
jgi:hypothetical protein